MLAPLGFVLVLSFGINSHVDGAGPGRCSGPSRRSWALSLASIFLVYTGARIARVFFITAGTFARDEPVRLHDQARPVAASARS